MMINSLSKWMFWMSIFLLSGCATNLPLTREEQLALTQKKVAASQMNFKNVDREKLIKAIENTLYLIDPKDAKFIHTSDRIVMRRSYMTILLFANAIGEDIWIVNIKTLGNNEFHVSIALTGTQSMGMFVNSNVDPVNFNINLEDSWLSEAEARVVFERINHLLGRGDWISCEDAPRFAEVKRYKTGTIGRFPFVCGDNWHGVSPESPAYLTQGK